MKAKIERTFRVTTILNISAIIMGIFAVFNTYAGYKHIKDLVLKGFQIKSQLTEVINYYIASISPYIFYGLALFALSVVIRQNIDKSDYSDKIEENKHMAYFSESEEKLEKEDDDLVDDLIRELDEVV
ncbi:hypothetical protein [Clostridium weizhouense]|uniref:Uncharacterized protein n=1 Tax=Clostridium weizhouense TaxID=2859781 RepID=A0ABS7AQP5_9CLOT|nr:hypothetical protein [Clostridium weizhouense]MBW6411002.1 hypothetical protein [Clostridium weizhouense]